MRPSRGDYPLTPSVVHPIYKDQIQKYFDHYKIEITWKIVNGGELHKTMDVSHSLLPPT